MNETIKYDSTNFTANPSSYCWYRLPCGICTRTNQMCPMGASNTPIVTWTSTSTGEVKKNEAD